MRVAMRLYKTSLIAILVGLASMAVLAGPAQRVLAAPPPKCDPKAPTIEACGQVTCLNGFVVAEGTRGSKDYPAGTDCATTAAKCDTPSNCDLIQHYLNPAINFLAALVGVATVAAIIVGGIQYSSAGGNAQAVSMAKSRIRNAVIALIVFALLYAMIDFLIPGGIV